MATPCTNDTLNASPRSKSVRAIIAAARTLFLARGYDDVSTEEIARVAGVARQTLFNRFKSKDAVFRAVVADHWERWGSGVLTAAPAHDDPVEDHLRAVALSIVAFQESTEQIHFQQLIVSESRRLDWLGPAAYRAGKAPRMAALAGHLARLHDEGRLDCPHPAIAAWQFTGLIQEFLVWPKVMATGDEEAIPPVATVIAEAIATFMARYRPA